MTSLSVPPDSSSEALLFDTVRHQHFVERLKGGEARRAFRFLNEELKPELIGRISRFEGVRSFRSRKYRSTIKAIDKDIDRAARSMARELTREARQFAVLEADILKRQATKSLPRGTSWTRPSFTALQGSVTSEPLGGKFINEHFEEWAAATKRALRLQINLGISEGDTPSRIIGRARRTLRQAQHWLRTATRTSISGVQTNAREMSFEKNAKLIKRVRYVAVLDGRTSQICASLDGTEWDIGEGPRPPQHPNCRSSTAVIFKGDKNSGRLTYPEWFRRQTHEQQNEALGPTRAALFREGKISLNDMVDQLTRRPLTVAEIRENLNR